VEYKRWRRYLVIFSIQFFFIPLASADCLSLKKGPIVFDATGCKKIVPEEIFDGSLEKYSWINDLDPAGKKKLLDSYRGLYLKGLVVTSKAQDHGLSGAKGVLQGETIYMYMPPSANSCKNVRGVRLVGNLNEVCCDGSGDIPCMLQTSYLFQSAKAVGKAGSDAGDKSRAKAKKSKNYQLAYKAYRNKKWKSAAVLFEKARRNGALDIKGNYRLAHSYREMDLCKLAIKPLKHIQEMEKRKKIWGDEEPVARKAKFLLARCYSKMNLPSDAYMILSGYLLEPSKYQRELKQALKHKDFGWIHTSKQYREFKEDADKKIRYK
jgi:hypothetical protein